MTVPERDYLDYVAEIAQAVNAPDPEEGDG